MTVPTITPPPPAPLRNEQPTFSGRVGAFLTWMVSFVSELISLGSWMDGTAGSVQTNADAASSAAAAATAAANYKGGWSSLTGALNIPASVSHSSKVWLLLSNLADVTAKEPGVDPEWELLTATGVTRFNSYSSADSLTLAPRDFVTLTASGKTATLPPDPPAGTENAVAWGDWTDGVLDGNGEDIRDATGVMRTSMDLDVALGCIVLIYNGSYWMVML